MQQLLPQLPYLRVLACRLLLQLLHDGRHRLLEYETLSGDEISNLLKGELPIRDSGEPMPPTGSGPSSSVPTTGGKKGDEGGPVGVPPAPQGT